MTSSPRYFIRGAALLAAAILVCAAPVASLRADSSSAAAEKSEKAHKLPLSHKVEKSADANSGPYTLTLKNKSKESLKVSAKILLAVAFHAESKAKTLPEHTLAAGESWTIPELAKDDKVILSAAGFAPLEVTVH